MLITESDMLRSQADDAEDRVEAEAAEHRSTREQLKASCGHPIGVLVASRRSPWLQQRRISR